MTIINKENENPFLLLDGLQNGFSMIVDFLKYCKNVISIDNKQTLPNIDKNSLLLNVMTIYADLMYEDELMKEEYYLMSQLQDILEYFFSREIEKKNLIFMIDLLESHLEFLNKKSKLMRSFTTDKREFIKGYNIILEDYLKIFTKYESIFYTEIYVASNKHKCTLNNIYSIMKEDYFMKE